MRNEICKIIKVKEFFNIVSITQNRAKYTLKQPSILLSQNIYRSWLETIVSKTDKHFPVYVNETIDLSLVKDLKRGAAFIVNYQKFNDKDITEHNLSNFVPDNKGKCILSIILPQSEIMQFFLQWQRHRKFWWSSISTTPGLFTLNDFKYEDTTGEVNIIAQFPWGNEIVETVSVQKYNTELPNQSFGKLDNVYTLEGALFTILFDGLMNQTKEGYLRLNRKMAPYKISFAVAYDYEDDNVKTTLEELALLLNYKLQNKKISTWLPDFSLSTTQQLLANRQLGVLYTAVLNKQTLSDGILQLMNSSTMLMEQVHIADLDSYAALLFKN